MRNLFEVRCQAAVKGLGKRTIGREVDVAKFIVGQALVKAPVLPVVDALVRISFACWKRHSGVCPCSLFFDGGADFYPTRGLLAEINSLGCGTGRARSGKANRAGDEGTGFCDTYKKLAPIRLKFHSRNNSDRQLGHRLVAPSI